MAEEIERIYVIPLKKTGFKSSKAAPTSIKRVKEYLTHHMKVETDKIWIDDSLNSALWSHGKFSMPSKIRVKAVKFEDGVLTKTRTPKKEKDGIKYYDFVVNFFLADTEKVKNVQWDDELKIVEHTAFFLKCREQGLGVALYESVRVNHFQPRNEYYSQFRTHRADEFIKLSHEKYGIKKIIEPG